LRRHCGERAEGFINRGTPHATSPLLQSLLSRGIASAGEPSAVYLVAVDARSPTDDGGIVTRVRSMHVGMVVDREGRRRHDEAADTASTRYAAWGQRLADFPGQIGYLILDQRGLQIEAPSFYPPISAPDLAALARRLDLPAAALARSLLDYNAARPTLEPPFFAFPMRPGLTFTYHGVAVDSTLRICHQTQGPIANLFAAGMLMAPNLLGRGYLSSLALMIGLATGRAAGAAAAKAAQVERAARAEQAALVAASRVSR
jgi:tricarballylate dehydrogenase